MNGKKANNRPKKVYPCCEGSTCNLQMENPKERTLPLQTEKKRCPTRGTASLKASSPETTRLLLVKNHPLLKIDLGPQEKPTPSADPLSITQAHRISLQLHPFLSITQLRNSGKSDFSPEFSSRALSTPLKIRLVGRRKLLLSKTLLKIIAGRKKTAGTICSYIFSGGKKQPIVNNSTTPRRCRPVPTTHWFSDERCIIRRNDRLVDL